MPETAVPKFRHAIAPQVPATPAFCAYAELDVASNFSFLRGASHPDEMVYRAAELGYRAIAITDRNTLAGVVRAHDAAKQCGIKLIVGSRITLADGPPLLVWARDRAAYGRLCRMLSVGKQRVGKGEFQLSLGEFIEHSVGLLVAADLGAEPVESDPLPMHPHADPLLKVHAIGALDVLREALGERLSLSVVMGYTGDDRGYLQRMIDLSRRMRIPLLATNHVHYHDPARRALQDVLSCIRQQCTIAEAGYRLFPNGERYLKPPEVMHRLFADCPAALWRTIEIAQQCTFNLDELRYEYPDELCPTGQTPLQYLTELTWHGAAMRYPDGLPEKVRRQIKHELKLIEQLHFEAYFLTVYDLVKFARSRGILCQGRGSAANSAVCYCLGVTSVDPARIDLLFERFVSAARGEPPDIDIDFEHERREEVIQYIYGKYGRDRAGLTAEVISYRGRSAIRDVGKALGLSLDMVDQMAKRLDGWTHGVLCDNQLREIGLDPADATVRRVIDLSTQILGFPRHLSQHVGGMVMTRGPLCELVPIENAAMPDRTVIEWDKDDIDTLGILKVDCLGLGMLTCIGKAFTMINSLSEARRHGGTEARREGKGRRERGHGGNSDASGSDRLAEGNAIGATDLSGDRADARVGAIRVDEPDETSGSIHPIEYCRGLCQTNDDRLHQVPASSPRIIGRVVNAMRDSHVPRDVTTQCPVDGPAQRNRSRTPGPDSQPGEQAILPQAKNPRPRSSLIPPPSPTPSCLRASVPSCLERPLELHTIPPEDPAVYDMICDADTVGVFQIESRAQMSMLPRLRPRCFYDLVIEVAIVRPGPIQGNMVHPYLRRRNGEETVTYPSDALRQVLQKTLGVPLFQEQAMRVAMVGAGFSAEEADQLRRAMAAWRKSGAIERFRQKIIDGMLSNGYAREFAEQCFMQIRGFGEYGFPESHSASFALLVYVSAWLKRYYPAAFATALLNSQPMGFYAPAQIVRDARDHGVDVRPIDINHSHWDCTLEQGLTTAHTSEAKSIWGKGGPAMRIGFRQVKGLREEHANVIAATRHRVGQFTTVAHFHQATALPRHVLERLAEADAFGSLGLSRRAALWQVMELTDDPQPLFDPHATQQSPVPALLPVMPEGQEVRTDYSTIGLSLKRHPVAIVRRQLDTMKILTTAAMRQLPAGRWVKVAGLVLIRQRPATASGIVFQTLEDETGIANLIVRPAIYDRYRAAARHASLLRAEGYIERQGQVVHVMVKRLFDLSYLVQGYNLLCRDFH